MPGLDAGLALAAGKGLGPLDLVAVGVPETDVPCVQLALQEGGALPGLFEAALPPVFCIAAVAPDAVGPQRQLVDALLFEIIPGPPGLGASLHGKAHVLPGSLVLAKAAGLPQHVGPLGLPDYGLPLAPQRRRLGSLGGGLHLPDCHVAGDGS